jgi:hypothetical protein
MDAMASLIRNLTNGQKGMSKPTTTTGAACGIGVSDMKKLPSLLAGVSPGFKIAAFRVPRVRQFQMSGESQFTQFCAIAQSAKPQLL